MDIFTIAAAKKLAGSGDGTGGSGIVQNQSDWNQNDSTQKDYIKNKPFYYGETYVEDLVMPTPTELYSTVDVGSDGDRGYALLGYKAVFEAGKTYTLIETMTQGENSSSKNIELTAYRLSDIGLPSVFSEAVALIDSSQTPYIIAGATLKDLQNFSDIALAEDTMYLTYKIKNPDISYTLICKEYNNMAQGYKTIDINYIPVKELNQIFNRKDELILGEQIADLSISESHLQQNSVNNAHISDNAITTDKILDKAVTTDKISDKAVTSNKISNNAITTDKISNYAITTDKILSKAITTDKISNYAITTDKILSKAIQTSHFAPGSISHQILEDYEICNTRTVTTNVVSISNENSYMTMGAREGIYIFDIISTDTTNTSQEIIMSMIYKTQDDSNIEEEVEIFREAFDFSEGKEMRFEVHLLKTNNRYFIGEVRAIGESTSMIKPIMFYEIQNYCIGHTVGLPKVKIAFSDSLNQQIAVGSKYGCIRQQENWVTEVEVVDDDVQT